MSPGLTQLTQRPETLAPPALAALIAADAGLTIDDLTVSVIPGGQAIVAPNQSVYANPAWLYYGHAVATFQQANLSDVFGTYDLRLMLNLPTSSGDVANALASIFGVDLTPADVVAESIPPPGLNGSSYVLKAAPSSTMWTGQRTVRLYPMTASEHLGLALTTTNLPGLVGPQAPAPAPSIPF